MENEKTRRLKYKLSEDETLTVISTGAVLHRIIYIDGRKGGWLESYDNLSQEGNCRVIDEAMVYGNAKVSDNAVISGNASVSDNATVYGNAKVYNNASVTDNARVGDRCHVGGYAVVGHNAHVYGCCEILENAKIKGDSQVFDSASVVGRVYLDGNVRICGDALVRYNDKINGDAVIKSNSDFIVLKNFWSSGRYFCHTVSDGMWHVGCFHGTGDELVSKAYNEDFMKGRMYEECVRMVENLKAIYNNKEFEKWKILEKMNI